jgi:nucleotide-binding universal stress UspA family protein
MIYLEVYLEMVNFKKIMIATDGSDCSRVAVSEGIRLAKLSGGTVYAVHVIPMAYLPSINEGSFSSISVTPNWESAQSIQESWEKQGQQAVNYIKNLGEVEGINVESVLLEGDPANELIKYAEKEKIDIVVMGTHGNTGFDRLLMGSVAGNVVRHSKVPVMVVRDKCNS